MAQRGTRVEIDLNELERLCALQCTDREIAAWFGVTTRTIERRRLEPKFANAMERGKAKGTISVRRLQMKLLEQGNATMGVWLGKQMLGQVDQLQVNQQQTIMIVAPGQQQAKDWSEDASWETDVCIDVTPGHNRYLP